MLGTWPGKQTARLMSASSRSHLSARFTRYDFKQRAALAPLTVSPRVHDYVYARRRTKLMSTLSLFFYLHVLPLCRSPGTQNPSATTSVAVSAQFKYLRNDRRPGSGDCSSNALRRHAMMKRLGAREERASAASLGGSGFFPATATGSAVMLMRFDAGKRRNRRKRNAAAATGFSSGSASAPRGQQSAPGEVPKFARTPDAAPASCSIVMSDMCPTRARGATAALTLSPR